MSAHRLLSLLVVLVACSGANALFGHALMRCLFTSTEDVVYMEQFYFNKLLLGQYNSTLGYYTGYTAKTKDLADGVNKSPKFLEQAKKNLDRCKSVIPLVFDLLSKKPVEPTVKLKIVEATESRHPSMLVCSAYGFYPKHIQLSWLRDGNETKTDVTSTEELANGNWLYQIHSHLEFTPTPGEKISCRVEHASLMEPKLYDWEPVLESERNKYAVGTAGLVLGLLVLAAGLIVYKKNSTDLIPVPTS